MDKIDFQICRECGIVMSDNQAILDEIVYGIKLYLCTGCKEWAGEDNNT